MTTHDLAPFVTMFFTRHLPAERNASPHTIAAYRDTLKLLLRFLAASMHRSAAALHVEDLTPARVLAFLDDLETTRRNTIRTASANDAAATATTHNDERSRRLHPRGTSHQPGVLAASRGLPTARVPAVDLDANMLAPAGRPAHSIVATLARLSRAAVAWYFRLVPPILQGVTDKVA